MDHGEDDELEKELDSLIAFLKKMLSELKD